MDDNQQVVPRARRDIHEVVLNWFSTQKRGRVLDVPAGYGHLSISLKDMGFDVVCGEIQPEIFRAKGLECAYVDLNKGIEAADSSFDYVCCVEGLEHTTDPYRAVAELSRVLKPGGVGVFSIPNYCNIESRLRYLFRGYLARPKTMHDYRQKASKLVDFHNCPLTITLVDFIFSINGLKIDRIMRDRVKRKQCLLIPLVAVIRLAAKLSSARAKKRDRYDLTLRNEVILGGNSLIFITRKEPQ